MDRKRINVHPGIWVNRNFLFKIVESLHPHVELAIGEKEPCVSLGNAFSVRKIAPGSGDIDECA
jgi:hypothetical protein